MATPIWHGVIGQQQQQNEQSRETSGCWTGFGSGSGGRGQGRGSSKRKDYDHGNNITNNNAEYETTKSSSTTTTTTPNNNSNDIDDVDLARELNALSVQERELIFEEIHGVTELPKETPEFIDEVMAKFDVEMHTIPRRRRQALDRAIFLKPSIETDTTFKLMFLRADYYNAVKATRRLAKYFEDKLELFGENKLVKTITLEDLNDYPNDMNVLEMGLFIVLPQRDSAGRLVWFCDLSKADFTDIKSVLRCSWYQIMTCAEDEATQLKGVSDIQYCLAAVGGWKVNVSFSSLLDIAMNHGDVLPNLPVRISGYHFCYNQNELKFVMGSFQRAFGRHIRLRLRVHFGSELEVRYSLLTFGISVPFLGITNNNNNNNSNNDKQADELHHDYIQQRWAIEKEEKNIQLQQEHQQRQQQQQQKQQNNNNGRHDNNKDDSGDDMSMDTSVSSSGTTTMTNTTTNTTTSSDIILMPNPNDVLVGRGRPYQNFSGNQLLGELIDREFLTRFNEAENRFEKTCIHMDVIKTFQNTCGGRFVERIPQEGWRVVDEIVARKKVGSAFRFKMAKLSADGSSGGSGGGSTTTASTNGSSGRQDFTATTPTHDAKRIRYDPSVTHLENVSSSRESPMQMILEDEY